LQIKPEFIVWDKSGQFLLNHCFFSKVKKNWQPKIFVHRSKKKIKKYIYYFWQKYRFMAFEMMIASSSEDNDLP
jgi:hypothetical protein